MNQIELLKALTARAKVPKRETRRVLTALTEIIHDQLAHNETVRIAKLGTFAPRQRKSSTIRDIRGGRRMVISGRTIPTFKASAALKRALATDNDDLWRQPGHQAAWRLAETLVEELAARNQEKPTFSLDSSESIRNACDLAFGNDWAQCLETYDAKTPEAVRNAHDYLVDAARRRWS